MNAAVRFFDLGVGLYPIVTPGKTPRCKSEDDYVCSRDEAARFRNYGVRLAPARSVGSVSRTRTTPTQNRGSRRTCRPRP